MELYVGSTGTTAAVLTRNWNTVRHKNTLLNKSIKWLDFRGALQEIGGVFLNVFLSSTYEDLKDYRKSVIKMLLNIRFNINAMEFWCANPNDPLSVCLQYVRESDIVIFIIAHRYGAIDDISGLSLTECEYNCAFKNGKQCLVFIQNNDNRIFIEREENKKKLRDFKAKLKNNHVCCFFSSPEELRKKIKLSLMETMKEKSISLSGLMGKNEFWEEVKGNNKKIDEEFREEYVEKEDAFLLLKKIKEIFYGMTNLVDGIINCKDKKTKYLDDLLAKNHFWEIANIPNVSDLDSLFYYKADSTFRVDWEYENIGIPNIKNVFQKVFSQMELDLIEKEIESNGISSKRCEMLQKAQSNLSDILASPYYYD